MVHACICVYVLALYKIICRSCLTNTEYIVLIDVDSNSATYVIVDSILIRV